MREVPLWIALLAVCCGGSRAPLDGAGAPPSPMAPPAITSAIVRPAPAQSPAAADPSTASTPEGSAPAPDDARRVVTEVSANTESRATAEWTLEAKGFPAVSKSGKILALAFGELETTGPPTLVLTTELRSLATGRTVRAATFRHPYTGELTEPELTALRKRLTAWVNAENAELVRADLIPIPPLEERDPCGAARDGVQKMEIPPLDVTLKNTRLVARYAGRALVDRTHPDWIVRDKNNRAGNCEYRPVLTGVFVDQERRALVIRADYCSPGDLCDEGVAPKFSVHRLP